MDDRLHLAVPLADGEVACDDAAVRIDDKARRHAAHAQQSGQRRLKDLAVADEWAGIAQRLGIFARIFSVGVQADGNDVEPIGVCRLQALRFAECGRTLAAPKAAPEKQGGLSAERGPREGFSGERLHGKIGECAPRSVGLEWA